MSCFSDRQLPPRPILRPSARTYFTAAVLLATGACAPAAPAGTPAPPAAAADPLEAAAAEHISPAAALDHIGFLASDGMRGRDTPSPELERAAEYIAGKFREAGLEPAGDADDDFMQRWPFEQILLDGDRSHAGTEGPGLQQTWEYGTDYFVIPGPEGRVEGSPFYLADPAEAATGLPPEVSGRPLMVFLPDGLGPEFASVIQVGMQSGVSAVILLMDPDTDESEIFQTARALEAGAAGVLPIPVVGLRYEVGRDLLRSAEVEPEGGRDPPGVIEELSLALEFHFESTLDDVPNVVGMIRGSDPDLADTYVVLTAHYDHVGVGPPDERGDSIYSGADDNASGTSVLMQVAAAMGALSEAPARSVVFLAVSGEEKGLLGSAYFAGSPTVPSEGIVANLNMDMVGRNHPDTLYAIGDEYTTIGRIAHRIAEDRPELGLTLAPDPEPEEQAFLRSDHFSFVEVGVPALMLTTWLHDEYHLPSDTPERIDADKIARVARLIFYLTHELASDPETPAWTEAGRELLRSLP